MSTLSRPVVLGDYQAYSAGSFLAFIAPFNRGSYIYGNDYTENISIFDSSLTSGAVMAWNWPNTPCPQGVYDFSAIDYGDYDNTAVPAPILSSTINDIQTLSETHSLSFSGMLQGFDTIDDMFLTASPGNENTQILEVEVFLHTPAYSAQFVQGARPIGTFQGPTINWTVALSPANVPDVLIMPTNQADFASGTIDLKAMLEYLVTQGVIPGTAYFNGFALGTETQQGSGSMTMSSFSVAYAASAMTTSSPSPADTLTLRMAEDAYLGNAQFVVRVDGTQIGSIMTASALHSTKDSNIFTLTGDWGLKQHDIQVQFLNDSYGGTSLTDRNLYINSIGYDGTTYAGTAATLLSNGTQDVTVGGSTAIGTPPADILMLHLSEDAWQGNAQFALTIDGKVVSAPQDVTTLHASDQWENLTFAGTFGAGTHTIGIEFTNDAYDGTPTTDRNLYINGVDLNGNHYGSGVTTLFSNGKAAFVVHTQN